MPKPMQSVTIAELVPDVPLVRGLYNRFGSLLLPAGAVLSEAMLTRLRSGKHTSFLIPLEAPVEAAVAPPPAATSEPIVVAPAASPALLSPAVAAVSSPVDSTATSHDETAAAPPAPLHPPEPDLPRDETRRRQAAANLRRRGADLLASSGPILERLPRRFAATPTPAPVVRAGRASVAWLDADIAAMRAERTAVLERIYDRLALGRRTHAAALVDLADELGDLAVRRADRFAALAALAPSRPDNLADHAFTVAVLAVGIATHRRWSSSDVRTVALAAMLADAGMLLLTPDIRAAAVPLTDEQRARLRGHPTHAIALIDLVETLPPAVSAIVLAHHERDDGTGYPRGLRSGAIHDGAKAIAVADTLAALTAPRPHRRAVDPFDAMITVINLASTGTLERASVGALLRCTGLFPVGSTVLLSTGHAARSVSLPDPARPDRPVVRLLDGPDADSLVDLSIEGTIRVARAGAAAALVPRE